MTGRVRAGRSPILEDKSYVYWRLLSEDKSSEIEDHILLTGLELYLNDLFGWHGDAIASGRLVLPGARCLQQQAIVGWMD